MSAQTYLKDSFEENEFAPFDIIFIFTESDGRHPSELTKAFSFFLFQHKPTNKNDWLSHENVNPSPPLVISILHQLHKGESARSQYQYCSLFHHLEDYSDLLVSIEPVIDDLKQIPQNHISIAALDLLVHGFRQTAVIDFDYQRLLNTISNLNKATFVCGHCIQLEKSKENPRPTEKEAINQALYQLKKQWSDLYSEDITSLFVDISANEFDFVGYDLICGTIFDYPFNNKISISLASRLDETMHEGQIQVSILAIRKNLGKILDDYPYYL